MSLEAMSVFVRNTRGAMPPYQKAILSDADLADIHAYLQSVPKPPDYKSIPLLNP
jgi:mono/diheme cytochrome c family protein